VTDQSTEARQQSWQVADCFFELIGSIIGEAEQLAQRHDIPAPFIKALHILECPLAMKDLGKRMHCDPSFVTLVADMLEKRGLARREPHPADRRVKNVVLTEDGVVLKQRLEAEITARMPWNRALSADERSQLLFLIRKMLSTDSHGAPATGAGTPDVMPGPLTSLLVAALQDSAPRDSAAFGPEPGAEPANPPAATGEVTSAASEARAAS
jgi:MarR family transcriptional regulator, organic hydroperoxide resistance regulator